MQQLDQSVLSILKKELEESTQQKILSRLSKDLVQKISNKEKLTFEEQIYI